MTCSIPGCDNDVLARGWCAKHYRRWHKYGDTSIVLPPSGGGRPGIPRKEQVGYTGIHARLRLLPTGPCAICGHPAEEWAYDHADPNEKISPEGKPYSNDTTHYFLICRSCHRRIDYKRKDNQNANHR